MHLAFVKCITFLHTSVVLSVVFKLTGGDSGDGRRRILAEAKSFGQFEPERAAGGASQHEHEPAAITYSGIFHHICSAGLWPLGQSAGA